MRGQLLLSECLFKKKEFVACPLKKKRLVLITTQKNRDYEEKSVNNNLKDFGVCNPEVFLLFFCESNKTI